MIIRLYTLEVVAPQERIFSLFFFFFAYKVEDTYDSTSSYYICLIKYPIAN